MYITIYIYILCTSCIHRSNQSINYMYHVHKLVSYILYTSHVYQVTYCVPYLIASYKLTNQHRVCEGVCARMCVFVCVYHCTVCPSSADMTDISKNARSSEHTRYHSVFDPVAPIAEKSLEKGHFILNVRLLNRPFLWVFKRGFERIQSAGDLWSDFF